MPTVYEIERIVIEKPGPNAEPFFGITLQKVECGEGGEVLSLASRHDVLYLKESVLDGDEVDLVDPVTNEALHISGGGMYCALIEVCKDMVAAHLKYKMGESGQLVDE